MDKPEERRAGHARRGHGRLLDPTAPPGPSAGGAAGRVPDVDDRGAPGRRPSVASATPVRGALDSAWCTATVPPSPEPPRAGASSISSAGRADLDRREVLAPRGGRRKHGNQVVAAAMLGHKADVGLMVLGPDLWRLRAFQTAVQAAGLEPVDSYVSLTELSEYAAGIPEEMRQARLFPAAPPRGHAGLLLLPHVQAPVGRPQLVRPRLRGAQGPDDAATGTVGRTLPRPGPAAGDRFDRPRRLGVGGDAVRRPPRRPEGVRLRDALRRSLGPLRRVRAPSTPAWWPTWKRCWRPPGPPGEHRRARTADLEQPAPRAAAGSGGWSSPSAAGPTRPSWPGWPTTPWGPSGCSVPPPSRRRWPPRRRRSAGRSPPSGGCAGWRWRPRRWRTRATWPTAPTAAPTARRR